MCSKTHDYSTDPAPSLYTDNTNQESLPIVRLASPDRTALLRPGSQRIHSTFIKGGPNSLCTLSSPALSLIYFFCFFFGEDDSRSGTCQNSKGLYRPRILLKAPF